MSATGLEVFDKTLQTTHIWLDEIMQELAGDRALFESTMQGFDGWVAAVRGRLVEDSDERGRNR